MWWSHAFVCAYAYRRCSLASLPISRFRAREIGRLRQTTADEAAIERWTTRDVKNARDHIPSVLGAKRKIEMTNIVYSLVIVVLFAQTGRLQGEHI